MRSAFGVDHGEIYKKQLTPDQEKAQRYHKVGQTLAGIGGTSAALGGATAGIGYAEHKGKDPMGFIHTYSQYKGRPISKPGQAKILRGVSSAHTKQAVVAGGISAASLGLAGSYRHRRKELIGPKVSKAFDRKKAGDTARAAGTVGLGGTAAAAGGYNAQFLTRHVADAQADFRRAHHVVALHNMGELDIPKKGLEAARKTRAVSARVMGVKGAGALASAGIAGAGGKAIYDLARKKPGKGLAPKKGQP